MHANTYVSGVSVCIVNNRCYVAFCRWCAAAWSLPAPLTHTALAAASRGSVRRGWRHYGAQRATFCGAGRRRPESSKALRRRRWFSNCRRLTRPSHPGISSTHLCVTLSQLVFVQCEPLCQSRSCYGKVHGFLSPWLMTLRFLRKLSLAAPYGSRAALL